LIEKTKNLDKDLQWQTGSTVSTENGKRTLYVIKYFHQFDKIFKSTWINTIIYNKETEEILWYNKMPTDEEDKKMEDFSKPGAEEVIDKNGNKKVFDYLQLMGLQYISIKKINDKKTKISINVLMTLDMDNSSKKNVLKIFCTNLSNHYVNHFQSIKIPDNLKKFSDLLDISPNEPYYLQINELGIDDLLKL
jgi:hypothetical protein